MIDGLGVGLLRLGFGFVFLRQALLEGLDALGKITHQLGDLAASAEQQKGHAQNQNPVPNAQ
jgi:hypothetical protein